MKKSERERELLDGRRGTPVPAAAALCVLALLSPLACEPLTRIRDMDLIGPSRPAARCFEGSEISLVTTRFAAPAPELYTRGDRFHLRFSFDPELVDLSHLRNCNLWSQDRPGGPWRRLGSYPARRAPAATIFKPPTDGAYGLRASAVNDDGSEVLIPGPSDQPLVWLFVDRSAPKLTWISPAPGTEVRPGQTVELAWGSSEMRFGEAPAVLEWSADGGSSWISIERVRSDLGTGSARWRVPGFPERLGGQPLLRITAWDLVGNRSSSILPLAMKGVDAPPPPAELVSAGASPAEEPAAARPAGVAARTPSGVTGAAHREGRRPDPVIGDPSDEEGTGAEEESAGVVEEVPSASGQGSPGARSVTLKNLEDAPVLAGGTSRYVFFSTQGFDLERTRVSLEWRAGTDAPWTEVGPPVPASDGKCLFKVPLVTTDRGQLRLTATEARGEAEGEVGSAPSPAPSRTGTATAESKTPLLVDSEAPVAEIRGVRRGAGGAPEVALNCFDRGPAGLAEVELFVTGDGGASYRAIAVEDPTKPVLVGDAGPRSGFRVAARDRAGNGTPRPKDGTPPEEVFEAAVAASLAVEDLEDEILRGGEQRYVLWRFSGPEGLKALVETSQDAGASWEPVVETPAAAGKALWISPGENCVALIRVRVRLPDGGVAEGRARPVRVDAAPPQLEAGQIPREVAGELTFPLAVTDPGGAGVETVAAYTRPAVPAGSGRSGGAWTIRPPDRVALDGAAGRMSISVADLPEGPQELLLRARDRAGNAGPAPGAGSTPLAVFTIDRTPVAIGATPTALPWVEGLTAAVQVEFDPADAVPPLWLEEKSGGGWNQILRWETFAPSDDLFRFPVPVGRSEYEVRFGIRDAVGNVSYSVVGPRPVERSIRLTPPAPDAALRSGANLPVVWNFHPALSELTTDLRVVVSHQPREGGDWVQLYDDLPAGAACVWTIPTADAESHRLRVRLLHRGKLLGEDQSAPFAIAAGPAPRVEPQVIPISENSLYYSDRAELQLEKYRSGRAQYQKWFTEVTAGLRRDARGKIPSEEMEKLPPDLRRQAAERERALGEAAEKIRENFQKAMELDPRNYRGAYGMAQLIHRTSPDQADEAIRFLERVVEIKADHAPALNDLGASLILRGEYEAAEEPLRRAVSVEDQGSYHYNLALALFHQKKTAEARRHFEDALSRGGSTVKSGEVYYYIVSTFLEEGRLAEARKKLEAFGQQIPQGLRDSLEAGFARAPAK